MIVSSLCEERIAAISLVRIHKYVRNSGSSSRSIEGEE
jgi:hypothetical protein